MPVFRVCPRVGYRLHFRSFTLDNRAPPHLLIVNYSSPMLVHYSHDYHAPQLGVVIYESVIIATRGCYESVVVAAAGSFCNHVLGNHLV